ncbi:hypothetical protein [Streptomyces sp. NPDC088789]|uniref:hypothetical protein n=1 Tax=Streptomyces sp. NPDC088789 TaxID=3365899 RepID=UPI0037F164E2
MAVEPIALRGDDLLRAAISAGFTTITERRLEDFRRDGLIPRPVRIGNEGRRPVWIYPPGSDHQLVQLLRWHERTSDVNELRAVLWIEGFPLTLDTVRAAVTAAMDGLSQGLEQLLQAEASRQGLDPAEDHDAVLGAAAATMAAKRGEGALPRPVRVPADQRATAFAYLLQIFGLGTRPDLSEDEAETIEKVLGVSPGRRQRVEGADPWLTGPASALADAAEFVSLPRLAEALADATDTEWQEARASAAALFLQLPVAARAVAAMTGKENYAGMGGHATLDSHPFMAVFLIAFILGVRRADWSANADSLTDALAQLPARVDEMKQVLDLPQSELDRNLAAHGSETQARTRRIIQALLDDELEPGPRPVP